MDTLHNKGYNEMFKQTFMWKGLQINKKYEAYKKKYIHILKIQITLVQKIINNQTK